MGRADAPEGGASLVIKRMGELPGGRLIEVMVVQCAGDAAQTEDGGE